MGEFWFIGTEVLIAKGQAALRMALGQAAEDLAGRAQGETPTDTGTLKASIHVDGPHGGGNRVYVFVQTGGEASDYAIFVHEGTGAHLITAKDGGWLHFGSTFAKVVHHPGTRAYKFIERPLLAEAAVYRAFLQAAVAAAF
jgi:hypothetical protein